MNTLLIAATAVYGTLVSGEMIPAPYAVIYSNATHAVKSLTEAQANEIGYKLVIDEPPACESNEYAVATGWVEGARITRQYRKELAPVAVAVYSVADLFFWLRIYDASHTDAPKGQAVTDWLNEHDLYTIAVTTQTVAADNEVFQPTLAAIQAAVGFTDAEIAEALQYAKVN